MKTFIFNFDDGPVAVNSHLIEIEAVNYPQAYKKAIEYIKEYHNWERIGEHNVRYHGLKRSAKKR